MRRFRKKPVEVEAARWLGPHGAGPDKASVDDLQNWGAKVEPTGHWGHDGHPDEYALMVWNEPEDCFVKCPVGHWVIRGVNGEFYPCDPDIFETTYEDVLI